MSAETIDWLENNSLIGHTKERGNAWHWREGANNHFEGPVPRERVLQLFSYPMAEGAAAVVVPVVDENGVETKVFPAPNFKGIVRLDTGEVFEFFKHSYEMHDPTQWCLEILETLADGLDIGSAIVLKGGAIAAVQVELPETRSAFGRGAEPVRHRPYLTGATSFNGSMSTTYLRGSKIWICDNTLAVAMGEGTALRQKYRHRKGASVNILDARENLAIVVEQIGDEVDAQIKALTEQYVTDQKFYEIVNAFTGLSKAKEGRGKTIATNRTAELVTLWHTDERVAPWKNSAWGTLAAFNTAKHHVFGKDEDRIQRNELDAITGKFEEFDRNILRLLETV